MVSLPAATGFSLGFWSLVVAGARCFFSTGVGEDRNTNGFFRLMGVLLGLAASVSRCGSASLNSDEVFTSKARRPLGAIAESRAAIEESGGPSSITNGTDMARDDV